MTQQTTSFNISGLSCGKCVAKVKKALDPFASNIEINDALNQISLENCNSSIDTLQKALQSSGDYILSNLPTSNLIAENKTSKKTWFSTYQPLLLIVTYLLLTTVLIQFSNKGFNSQAWMGHFMAGFFLVFSFFKLLDLKGFAQSYAMYDLLALKFPAYGYIYPFIELCLGFAYLLSPFAFTTNLIALIIMLFSSAGVILAVSNKQKIRCACLGSVFNLPMSTITIVEDLSMAAMAAWMLLKV